MEDLKQFIKTTIREFLNENHLNERTEVNSFDELVNKKFKIGSGSGSIGALWKKNKLKKALENVIWDSLFDWDFYGNWTDHGEEYRKVAAKELIRPMTRDMNKLVKKYFYFDTTPASMGTEVLLFDMTSDEARKRIDDWFKSSKSISDKLRQDYYDYRKRYYNVTLR